jgi:hypothetical protein
MNNSYQTLNSLVDAHKSEFLNADKSELGIFWLDDDLSMIIHSKTFLDENIDRNNITRHSFTHYNEWHSRPNPQSYPGSYNDYPRGRIFYQDGHYVVEANFMLHPNVESLICGYFNLPFGTIFKFGYR